MPRFPFESDFVDSKLFLKFYIDYDWTKNNDLLTRCLREAILSQIYPKDCSSN